MNSWLTLAQAASRTGLTAETVRKWATADPPRVRAREVFAGKRKLWEVDASDVLREAALTGRMVRRFTPGIPGPASESDAPMRDRLATLEDVTRIYRLIDELREQIEGRHLAIERLQRELATLLQAPSVLTSD